MEEYTTKDIARLTDIADTTVRKYAQLLEKNGYIFNRNLNGYRIFNDEDLTMFLEFKNESGGENSVEEIAHDIATKHIVKVDTSKQDMSDNMQEGQGIHPAVLDILVKKIDALTDTNQKQQKFNEELLKRLDQQQKYIENRFEEDFKQRQHLFELTASLKESMETRKLLAAAEEEKKKGFFSRLFHR